MNETSLRRSLTVSLILHSLIFAPLVLRGCGGGDGTEQSENKGGNKEDEERKIKEKQAKEEAEKDRPIEVSIVNLPPKPKTPHEDEECPSGKFYGGIGIYTTYYKGHWYIGQAVKGYPAYNAGLQRGDEILSPGQNEIRGEIGTPVRVTVFTMGGNTLTVDLIRDKICLEDKPNEQKTP